MNENNDIIKITLPTTRKSKNNQKIWEHEHKQFALGLQKMQYKITGKTDISESDKISARGWCYILEGLNLITKNKFSDVEKKIKICIEEAFLPINFIAIDKSRVFSHVESLTDEYVYPENFILMWLDHIKKIHKYKEDIAFWKHQPYYIQMLAEKIDIRNLFSNICEKYHIPIANSKGWGDRLSRYHLALRFKEAEELGLQPVLLYYGDFDPAGHLIANFIKKNITDIEKQTKWIPTNLIIDFFGLGFDFINNNNLLWINNLTSSNGRDIGYWYEEYKKTGTKKKIYDYEIEYIEKYGIRKCEANAILPIRNIAIQHCEATIRKYLGDDPFNEYNKEVKENQKEVKTMLKSIGFKKKIFELKANILEIFNHVDSN